MLNYLRKLGQETHYSINLNQFYICIFISWKCKLLKHHQAYKILRSMNIDANGL